MTNTLEKCTEIVQDTYLVPETISSEHTTDAIEFSEEKITPKPSTLKLVFYYLLQIEGDPEFRLSAKSARKNGIKAEFTPAGWIYQKKEEGEEVANRWTKGKRRLKVVRWFDPEINSLLDQVWKGSKEEIKLAKKKIGLEITKQQHNKKKQIIEMNCYEAGLHYSWLHSQSLPDDMSENEKKIHSYYKPLWDKTFEEQEKIELKESDISKEEEDIEIHNDLPVSFNIIEKSLIRNERGDAELFLKLLENKYLFDSSEGKNGEFYIWTGTYWLLDRRKRRYKDIESVSSVYEKAAIEAAKEESKKEISKELSKRAHSLRSSKRCKSVFEFVATEIHIEKEWDYCPEKLPCLNGVVDLKTGAISIHKPDNCLRSICPTSYNPNTSRPLFDKFLDDITLGNLELKSFLGRVFGSALLGTSKEEKIFILYGKDGRNGKGTLMQTIEKVLGPLAKTFPSEMLLLQRNPPSSSTPRPEKANLQGVRFAIFSEIDEKRQIDASEVKNLSGGDTITCRRLFSNVDIQIRPSHTMFIQTNFKPKASAKDGALWKRNILIPFNAEFVEEPDQEKPHQRKKDEGFKEKLLLEKEGILAWLIEGCLEYQKIGLSIPEIVKNETATYRKENDGIQLFIEEMCIQSSEFSAPKSKMTAAIQKYCKENSYETPNRNEISTTLKQKFKEGHNRSGDFWCGIKIYDEKELQED